MSSVIDLSSASTAEGQVLQLIYAMNNLENANLDSDGNPVTDNIQITPNAETGVIAVTLNLPVTTAPSANGATYTADNFLVD